MLPRLRRVVVTGMGLVTPLGCGVEFVWKKLLEGASGVVALTTSEKFSGVSSRVAGLVPEGAEEGKFDLKSAIPDPKVDLLP